MRRVEVKMRCYASNLPMNGLGQNHLMRERDQFRIDRDGARNDDQRCS